MVLHSHSRIDFRRIERNSILINLYIFYYVWNWRTQYYRWNIGSTREKSMSTSFPETKERVSDYSWRYFATSCPINIYNLYWSKLAAINKRKNTYISSWYSFRYYYYIWIYSYESERHIFKVLYSKRFERAFWQGSIWVCKKTLSIPFSSYVSDSHKESKDE